MPLTDFSQTRVLGEAALRECFAHGDAQERVWCAWALGLRMQAGLLPLIIHQARADEDPGVRRHCVIMLAGAGELDLLAAIASHDGDEHVRATALQYVALLLEDQPAALFSFVEDRLRLDTSTWVRAAAIQNLPNATPMTLQDLVLGHLDDADMAVREAAVDRTLAWRGVVPALQNRLKTETAQGIRHKILTAWWNDDGEGAILNALHTLPVMVQREALEVGQALGSRAAREHLQHHAQRTRPGLRGALALINPQ